MHNQFLFRGRLALMAVAIAAFAHGATGKTPAMGPTAAEEAAKDALLATLRVVDISDGMPAGRSLGLELEEAVAVPELQPRAPSTGNRRGDLDTHFGNDPAEPGRAVAFFDIGDLEDRAFGVLVTDSDSVYTIGRAGTLANGTRIGISAHLPNGMPDLNLMGTSKQTLAVIWTNATQLDFIKAIGVHGMVGSDFLQHFYVLGQLNLTGTPDGDSDFVVLCLRFNGFNFEICPNFGGTGNGMARVAFDAGGTGFRKDIPHDLFADRLNGKLLLAGSAQLSGGLTPGADFDFAIARLHLLSGVLDPTFSGDGRRTLAFDINSAAADEALSIHVRPFDNKIIVAGRANVGLISFRSAMAQLNDNGTMDTGFCAPAVASCDSPSSHRSGRRLWNDESGVFFNQVTALLGGGLGLSDSVVVRTRVPNTDSATARVSRVGVDGGCTVCLEATLAGFDQIRPVAAMIDQRFLPPFVLISGIQVATYGVANASGLSNTHIFRILADMSLDGAFTSLAPFSRQDYDFPAATGQQRQSRPAAMAFDSRGRTVIAGSRRWSTVGNDWDYAIARLQNDVILAHGFDW